MDSSPLNEQAKHCLETV